jgi:hypothetical protein
VDQAYDTHYYSDIHLHGFHHILRGILVENNALTYASTESLHLLILSMQLGA